MNRFVAKKEMFKFLQEMNINKYSRILTQDPKKGGQRAMMYPLGFTNNDFKKKKAIIGIANMQYDGNPCNIHTGELSKLVQHSIDKDKNNLMKSLKFSTSAVSDGILNGTLGMRYSLFSRENIANSVEMVVGGHYYDGIIGLPSCDKNYPGVLMGMIRLNRPSIIICGGSINPGIYKNKPVDIVSAFQSYGKMLKSEITSDERNELLQCCCPGSGSCGGMYTANTMASVFEAMGLTLPYSSSNTANSKDKLEECSKVGSYIYNLLKQDIKPSDIITRKSIENGIVTGIALGGSTNLVLHILAIAKTAGIDLSLDDIEEIGKKIPVIGNLKPHGEYLMNDIYLNGGTPVVLKYLLESGYLYNDCLTVTGKTLEKNLENVKDKLNTKIFHVSNPIKKSSHIKILKGSLSKNGCVAKVMTDKDKFIGKALVFNSEEEFLNFFDDVDKNSLKKKVIIIRYQGPKGGPGMPEMLSATSAIVGCGLGQDVVMVTDGRFSGGSTGDTIIGHVCPEAFDGGEIAIVKNGDQITVDLQNGLLNLDIDDNELINRKKLWKLPSKIKYNISNTSCLKQYRKLVGKSSEGAML